MAATACPSPVHAAAWRAALRHRARRPPTMHAPSTTSGASAPPQLANSNAMGPDEVARMCNDLESTLSQARLLVEQYRSANPLSRVLLGVGKRFDATVAILSRPLGQGPPVGWLTMFTDPSDIHLLSRPRHTVQVGRPVAPAGRRLQPSPPRTAAAAAAAGAHSSSTGRILRCAQQPAAAARAAPAAARGPGGCSSRGAPEAGAASCRTNLPYQLVAPAAGPGVCVQPHAVADQRPKGGVLQQ
jgi:hypothetical protein